MNVYFFFVMKPSYFSKVGWLPAPLYFNLCVSFSHLSPRLYLKDKKVIVFIYKYNEKISVHSIN